VNNDVLDSDVADIDEVNSNIGGRDVADNEVENM
jgi:hypothetical protein